MKKLAIIIAALLLVLTIGGTLVSCDKTDQNTDEDDYIVTTFYFPNWAAQDENKPFNPVTDSEWGGIMRSIPRFEGH